MLSSRPHQWQCNPQRKSQPSTSRQPKSLKKRYPLPENCPPLKTLQHSPARLRPCHRNRDTPRKDSGCLCQTRNPDGRTHETQAAVFSAGTAQDAGRDKTRHESTQRHASTDRQAHDDPGKAGAPGCEAQSAEGTQRDDLNPVRFRITMKKSILEIYALAVCFFSVICLMFSAGFAAYAVVRIAKPNFTMNDWQHQRYQSNDAFWAAESSSARITRKDEPKQPRPSEAELSRRRQQGFSAALKEERRGGAQTLVKSLIITLIDIAVFSVHWRIARRSVGMQ